jgi:hypothetical protein
MTVIVSDSFNRADSSTLGTTETGHVWEKQGANNFGIVSNQAGLMNNGDVWAFVDSGIGDNFNMSVDYSAYHLYSDLIWRWIDSNNYFWLEMKTITSIKKRQNGSVITLGSVSGVSWSGGEKISIKVEGNIHTAYVNGVELLSVSDSTHVSATRHGFKAYSNTARFDNFLIESLGTTDPEEPIGEDGSTSFDLLQFIYTDSITQADTRQTIYSDGYINGDTRQTIYQDGYTAYDLRQTLYANLSTSFDTKQAIFEVSAVHMDTKQVIYETASTAFDMLQEYYQDRQTGSTPFDMRIQLYEDDVTVFDSKQEWYEESFTLADLKQAIYEAGELNGDMKLILYSDSFIQGNLRQLIYSDEQIHFDTKQTLYDSKNELIGVIHLKGERKLYIELQGKRDLYIPLKGGVSMTVNNSTINLVAGDSKYLVVSVDGISDLNGCTFKWGLHPRNEANILEKTSTSGISIVDGKVQIKLDPADTEILSGTYYHECEMTDTLGNVSTLFTGLVSVSKSNV